MELLFQKFEHKSSSRRITRQLGDKCIDARHLLIARRGKLSSILSDNGTNFVGAANEFRQASKDLTNEMLQ